MRCSLSIRASLIVAGSATSIATGILNQACAAVLYSNLQGNYLSQQTSSYTITKGSNSASGYSSDFDFGATGFGDDYTVDPSIPTGINYGVSTVQLSSISFYGGVTPANPGNPAGSLGVAVSIQFYTSAGVRVPTSVNATTQFQGAVGLHTISFLPINVPASGYIVFEPYLYSTNGGFGPTPTSYGTVSMTGYFGAAPIVGTDSGTSFASTDTSGTLSATAAQASSPAYLQIQLNSVPEPASLSLLALGAAGLLTRRKRQA